MNAIFRFGTLLPALLLGVTPINAQVASKAADQVQAAYRFGSGDRIKIIVYNVDKLSGEFPVGGDGKIALPILGRLPVSGMTIDEVTQAITMRLADGLYLDPKVTVDIAAYRPVYILGEVQKPGQYSFAEGMTAFQLVAQAGGFTYRANRKSLRVRHDSSETDTNASIDGSARVMPGDTIYVRQRYF